MATCCAAAPSSVTCSIALSPAGSHVTGGAGSQVAGSLAVDEAAPLVYRHGVERPGPSRGPDRRACCRSSVVEHSLGKGEVGSSILLGSTSVSNDLA